LLYPIMLFLGKKIHYINKNWENNKYRIVFVIFNINNWD